MPLLPHIKQQKLCWLFANTFDLNFPWPSCTSDEGTVALAQLDFSNLDPRSSAFWLSLVAHHNVQIDLPLALFDKVMSDTLSRVQNTRAHAQVRVHWDRLRLLVLTRVAIHRLHDPQQAIGLHLVGEFAGLVRRRQAADVRLRPDLEEVHVFVLVAVVLRVANTGAGGSELDFAAAQLFEVAHAVLVLELAIHDVRPDEELRMAVSAEAGAAADAVFIDHAERPEFFKGRVVVAGETEGVEGVQPAVVCMAARVPWSFHDLEVGVGG